MPRGEAYSADLGEEACTRGLAVGAGAEGTTISQVEDDTERCVLLPNEKERKESSQKNHAIGQVGSLRVNCNAGGGKDNICKNPLIQSRM